MKYYFTILLFVVKGLSIAQFSDDFSDGDFSNAPTWIGETGNFEVDGLFQLHVLAPAVSDTSYLSLNSASIENGTWEFYVSLDFNPSSSNLARIYLVSDNPDLQASLNGYFVLVGDSDDEVSLYRQDGLSTTKIIDGTNGTVNMALVKVRIQVTRDASGNWELLIDNSGGTTFVSEGTIFDDTYFQSAYSGVFCKYTSTRSDKFYFDDFVVTGTPYVDTDPPLLTALTPVSGTELDLQFNETMDQATVETTGNYNLDGGIGTPSTAFLDGGDPSLVHLTFTNTFSNGATYNLTVNNVEDTAGNSIATPTIDSFLYFVPETPAPNDVIITEILGDPSPVVGLPEVDFIEIYNRSNKYFDLNNWSIEDAVSEPVPLGNYLLVPGEYVVLTDIDSVGSFAISNVLGVSSFPSLNVTEDAVVLKDDLGNVIDSVYYFQSWYNNDIKEEGGWSLERRHLDAPCSDETNWGASTEPSGGTPGLQNSIWTDEDDTTPPSITSWYIMNDTLIEVVFNETMDSSMIPVFSISPSIPVTGEWVNEGQLEVLPDALMPGTIYELQISAAQDCWGNMMNSTTIQIGLPEEIEPEDIILNEIMFNPLTNGSDYVEIYNNSDKIIDLNGVLLANWDDDVIANFKSISSTQRLVFPGEYVLVTEDTNDIIHDFTIYGLGTFIQTDIPTYNNDSGTVYVLNPDTLIIDYFHFDEDYHYELISDPDGKSLERITFGGGMNNHDNWHTASEEVEWGTPGYKNSQQYFPEITGEVTLDPQLFSPDNDGYNDVLTINLNFTSTDNVVDIRIYDNRGRLVRELKDNYFVGNEALITWDGTIDEGGKAPIGSYVVLVAVFNEETGEQTQYKKVCVVGGKL